jgi:signal transduction histidine kinase/ActR/RegA family two-component response regulator
MTAPSPPPVDPRVLGKILLIQTTIHAIPSSKSIAEFVCRGLEEIPGARGVAVRIQDSTIASSPGLVDRLRADDRSAPTIERLEAPARAEQQPSRGEQDGLFFISIRTIHRTYGTILFAVGAERAWEPYRPFLESLANTIALTLENQDHADALKRLNEDLHRAKEGLELQVRERTSDLVDTNAALAKEIEERKRFEQELRQAQKMEAIGTLAGGIAHDFNNILSAIIGYSELAKMRLKNSGEVSDHLAEVVKAGQRASELVRQILTFSRRSGEESKPLLIQPIVKEALKFLRASLPSNIEIVQDIASDAPQVLADPTQVHQVIMNLCTNAYHAMQASGGELRVSLSPATLGVDHSFSRSTLPPGEYAKLEVSDTGCGMDAQTIERIFDPYYTTKEKGRGTGLGLSVVHGIVQSFHGRISVISEPGRGSTFTVHLPSTESVDAPQQDADMLPPLRGNERVWVVDDERSIALLEKEMLESLGYSVQAFTSGPDLLQAFQDRPEGCDLIVSDMGMPRMNGVELARKILTVRPGLPLIICTGFSDALDKEQALAMGIRDYLMKPVDLRMLGLSIRNVLDSGKTALSD